MGIVLLESEFVGWCLRSIRVTVFVAVAFVSAVYMFVDNLFFDNKSLQM
jgi:hypothetical protein